MHWRFSQTQKEKFLLTPMEAGDLVPPLFKMPSCHFRILIIPLSQPLLTVKARTTLEVDYILNLGPGIKPVWFYVLINLCTKNC